jgi:MarR family transcriptional regulator, organic hydroperoxide resistance regulator
MLRCGKHDKEKSIQEIQALLKKIPQLLSRPDLDEWRKLTVPMAQLKALFLIVNGQEVNSRTLAENLEVTPGNVTGIVDRLAEQDLVVRKPDPQDRRVIWLEATPKGKELLGKLIEDHTKQFTLILDYMKAGELRALTIGLNGLVRAVEGHISELKESNQKQIRPTI